MEKQLVISSHEASKEIARLRTALLEMELDRVDAFQMPPQTVDWDEDHSSELRLRGSQRGASASSAQRELNERRRYSDDRERDELDDPIAFESRVSSKVVNMGAAAATDNDGASSGQRSFAEMRSDLGADGYLRSASSEKPQQRLLVPYYSSKKLLNNGPDDHEYASPVASDSELPLLRGYSSASVSASKAGLSRAQSGAHTRDNSRNSGVRVSDSQNYDESFEPEGYYETADRGSSEKAFLDNRSSGDSIPFVPSYSGASSRNKLGSRPGSGRLENLVKPLSGEYSKNSSIF